MTVKKARIKYEQARNIFRFFFSLLLFQHVSLIVWNTSFLFHNIWHFQGMEGAHKSQICHINPKRGKEWKTFILPDVVSLRCLPFELEIHKTPCTIIGCVEVVSLNLIKDLFGTKRPESNKYIHLTSVFNHSQREFNDEKDFSEIFCYTAACAFWGDFIVILCGN